MIKHNIVKLKFQWTQIFILKICMCFVYVFEHKKVWKESHLMNNSYDLWVWERSLGK